MSKPPYKIIAFTRLLITLIGFLVPVNFVSAQSIYLESSFRGTTPINQDLVIPATTSNKKSGVDIKFSSGSNNVSFSPFNTCKTDTTGGCSVVFKTTKTGTFTIALSASGYTPLMRDITVTPAVASPQVILGNCLVENLTSSSVVPNKTITECNALKVTTAWTPNPGNTLLGNCVVNSGVTPQVIPNKTIIECNKYKVATTWTQNSSVPIGSTGTPREITTTSKYKPLAPLPGMDETIDVANTNAFGKYINVIIKLAIGFSAVLAVLMIIMGGLEYITSELPGAKGEGKQRITNAVIGLLVALGAWLLLFTINPKLLETDLSKLEVTTIQFEDEVETPPTATQFDLNPPSGTINLCGEGIMRINTSGGSFAVCKKISANLQNMVNLAKSQGYNLSGWGYRSRAKQVSLRISHCGENNFYNVYEKPSSQCRPPTARPGRSRHESGLAVDFTCDGVSIQARDNRCFLWLKNNAGRYGLSNLPSEPWHWSIDGK